MALIDCPKCGQTMSDRAFKCPHCGAVTSASTSTSTTPQPTPKPQRKKPSLRIKVSKKQKRVLLYVLLGVVVLGGTGGFFYYQHHSKIVEERTEIREKGRDAFFNKGDNDLAFKLFLQAAEMGDPIAQNNVGACYLEGLGVEVNVAEAIKWYKKSAKNGCAKGQENLARCYFDGIGVEQSASKGHKWLLKAAEGGEPTAMILLAAVYSEGIAPFEQDEVKAQYWKEQYFHTVKNLTEEGKKEYNVLYAECILRGFGVNQDYDEGVRLMEECARQGDERATETLMKEGIWTVVETDSVSVDTCYVSQ